MSTSNAEMYRKVSEFYRELKSEGVIYNNEALDFMYQAALEKIDTQSKFIGEIDNDTIIAILNQHFMGNGFKFIKPDGNILPTVRIRPINTKYLKDDGAVSLTEEFYQELERVLTKYKIPVIQWNNNRTSFWWTPNK